MGPLSGIKVVDLTSILLGPYATQTMAQLGADVIKVESPDGDLIRKIGPMRSDSMGPLYLNVNKGKRSISLDLKQPEGREVMLRLAAWADVLVYNVRPAAMRRLGLAYEDVRAVNPAIIYAGAFGYGEDGPYAGKPAYDDLIQGASGLAHLMARGGDGTPRYVPNAIADRVVGLVLLNSILAGIVHRDRTGQGQRVDVPMFETMASFVLGDHMGGLTFDPPLDQGGYARHLSPDRRPYRTKDSYVCALVYNDKQWRAFFHAAGRDDLRDNPIFSDYGTRAENIDEIYALLTDLFLTKTTAEWLKLLDEGDIPAMPMHDLESILLDPHLATTDLIQTVEHPTEGPIRTVGLGPRWYGTPLAPPGFAPRIGADGIGILRDMDYSPDAIEALEQAGVVRVPAEP